jgi:hypothetical protein
MDSIHGRVAMHDVDGNGKLDIIANDINGNLAVFDHEGNELWSTQFTQSSHAVRPNRPMMHRAGAAGP